MRSKTTVFQRIHRACSLVLGLGLMFGSQPVRASKPNQAARQTLRKENPMGRVPVYFEPNVGQFDPQVRFYARGAKYQAWITDTEAVLSFPASRAAKRDVVRITFADRPPRAAVGLDALSSYSNYFIGSDRKNWRSRVPNFARIRLEEVYPGIDIVFYGKGKEIEYDFVVKPNADPGLISLRFDGPATPRVDAHGNLSIAAGKGTFTHRSPVAFQDTTTLYASATLDRGRLRFRVAHYDRSRTLTIDPVLAYSTFIGGSGTDSGSGVAIDSVGNAYISGSTPSANFPVTAGAADTAMDGGNDVFISKMNAAGTALIYSTFLGGSSFDHGVGIAVNNAGEAFVTGNTQSLNFPTTPGALDASANGYDDAFVTKLDASGAALLYSTYVGGMSVDVGRSIAVDGSGNSLITGTTASTNFPITPGAVDNALVAPTQFDGYDAFVVKLNPTGTAFVYSTFLGGSKSDHGYGIAVDPVGNAYITGYTYSLDFLVTGGDTVIGGQQDAFVTKLNPAGGLVYSTYLGGSNFEQGYAIAVDTIGNAYVCGTTGSANFPVTPGAFDTTFNQSPLGTDTYVGQLNPSGTAFVWATYLGGTQADTSQGIALDASAQVYVTGQTYSADFPTTAGAYDTIYHGGPNTNSDGFFVQFSNSGNVLYSTFFGAAEQDAGTAIAVDASGNAAIVGTTTSTTFPTTAGAFDTTLNGAFTYDVFLMRMATSGVDATPPSITPMVTPVPNASGWNNTPVTVSWMVTDPDSTISVKTGCDPVTLNANTPLAGTTLTCTATSAGGTASKSIVIKIDLTAPLTNNVRSPLPNGNGWNKTNVDVNFTCADALSGAVTPPATVTRTQEGAGQTASFTCWDLAGNSSTVTVTGINIDKTAPIVASQAPSPNPAPVNTAISVQATLTDAGGSNLAKADYRVGGGAFSLLAPAAGANATVSGSIGSIATPAVSDVCVRAQDLADNIGAELCQAVTVYDPADSVSGSGQFNSPPGALVGGLLMPGISRMQFTFGSSYPQGGAVPGGATQFKMKEGSFEFNSLSYDSLVVSGPRAQYRGVGTMNGQPGTVQFILTTIDGQASGGGGQDRIRLKISGPGGVLYDNQMGVPDSADPVSAIVTGDIVVVNN